MPQWHHERHGHAVDEGTRAAILAITPPAEALRKLRKIDWGGGQVIQHLIRQFWDGEGGHFDVTDLAGIGVCESPPNA